MDVFNSIPREQKQQIKAFKSRKKRDNGNERLRLAKAIQWYFFYGALIVIALFLIHYYPNVLNMFSSVNSYIVVIVFYVLMYGIVFVAYMTTPWPYPLLYEKSAAVRGTDWSHQLCWVERIMTAIYFTFYFIYILPEYMKSDKVGAIIFAAFQISHVFTSLLGFPTKLPLQLLGVFFRFFGLILSFAQLHLAFIDFNKTQTLAINGILGALPFALLLGMYFNGRMNGWKRRGSAFWWGTTDRRDLVILAITGISFVIWEGLLFFMIFVYTTPMWSLYYWTPLVHEFAALPDFLFPVITACMAIMSIPLFYHSNIDFPKTFLEKKEYLSSSESTMLINMVELDLPNSAPHNFMDDIALVIACHESKENIIKTLEAATENAHFPCKNIYVAHNAGGDTPKDITGPVVWKDPRFQDVHYIYIPVGNKSIAMNYVVEYYIKPAGISQVVMIDDDVLFPDDIDLKGGYEQIANDDKVKAVAFTIRGLEDANLWQKFQHMEYMQAGHLKMFQGQFGSVLTCHGAISLWEVQACIDVFALHNTEFHGEDLQMGLILRKMNKEYRIEANAVGPVATASPKSLLYDFNPKEKSLFSQRVFSWDMAAHHFFMDFMQLVFVNWEKNGLILKPFLIIELWTMIQDWLRFLFLVNIFQVDPVKAIGLVAFLLLLQVVVVLVFDRMVLSHRPELQSPTYICLLYPFYNVSTVMFRFVGLLYNAVVYTPWNPPRILIKDRKMQGNYPPKVIEVWGDFESRTNYWYNVWIQPDKYAPLPEEQMQKFATEAQAIVGTPPVVVPGERAVALNDEARARIASVASLIVSQGPIDQQPVTPRELDGASVIDVKEDAEHDFTEPETSPALSRKAVPHNFEALAKDMNSIAALKLDAVSGEASGTPRLERVSPRGLAPRSKTELDLKSRSATKYEPSPAVLMTRERSNSQASGESRFVPPAYTKAASHSQLMQIDAKKYEGLQGVLKKEDSSMSIEKKRVTFGRNDSTIGAFRNVQV